MWIAIAVANIAAVGDPLESCSAVISVALTNLSSNAAILDSNFVVSLLDYSSISRRISTIDSSLSSALGASNTL